ncbi:MAG TPA: DUF2891 domain-containing protein [Rhizomicrobium sp.]
MHELTLDKASLFARTALGHVTQEWPNKIDHVLTGPEDVKGPSALHPVFYGSFDWHSCVHSHWLLARALRRFPNLPEAGAIRALLDDQFTPEKVAGEVAYLARPASRGFERPYGWAWLLMLQGELAQHADARWADTLKPLADAFVTRFREFLPLATYPVRTGMHSSTAFAMILAQDYARAMGDDAFAALCNAKLCDWHGADTDCRVFEPSQSDFLSPTLTIAAAMRGALGKDFAAWFARYLPNVPSALLTPAIVSDRSDGQIAHLDGLNLSRAWCWRLITRDMPNLDPRIVPAVDAHLQSAMPHVTGDYMGEHWLASFALLALDP